MRFLRRVSFLRHVPDEPWANRKPMSPDHSVPTTIGGYRIGIASALKFGFLISCYQIFAFGKNARVCNTFHKGSLGPVTAAWTHLQWWLTPKSLSWLAISTLFPNGGESNACRRDIPSESPATILKAITGT